MPGKPLNTLARIVLWFVALLLGAILFSMFVSRGVPNLFIVRLTLIFALPAWLLYLPLVVAYPEATGSELRNLLIVGFLIGPVTVVGWGALALTRGATVQSVWKGDPLAGGLAGMLICGLIVGSLTTIFYVAALRLIKKKSPRADST